MRGEKREAMKIIVGSEDGRGYSKTKRVGRRKVLLKDEEGRWEEG